jgi:hypothetical protein
VKLQTIGNHTNEKNCKLWGKKIRKGVHRTSRSSGNKKTSIFQGLGLGTAEEKQVPPPTMPGMVEVAWIVTLFLVIYI